MRLGKDRVDFQDLASSWWRPVFLTELQRPMLNEDVVVPPLCSSGEHRRMIM